ncbi:Uncharacterised protein [BD1-7 clade bacterium]|uniref:Uncharacterized protein n=1 Tax=BD1-7 clade bacterium TaxID=2029982 RepID=A0A5S9PEU6_9GAMM|nr:Uncharacterised protein [BD1-7 clade bacterium]CAA0102450.1 Uncharacterised protein [BD1-7 clade bacterium]
MNYTKPYKAVFVVLALLCHSVLADDALDRFGHAYPLPYSDYASADAVIKDVILNSHWRIVSEKPNVLRVMLSNYKGYDLVSDLKYTDNEITVNLVSHKRVDCQKQADKCGVPQKYLQRWLMTLRQRTALKLQHLAIIDAKQKTG